MSINELLPIEQIGRQHLSCGRLPRHSMNVEHEGCKCRLLNVTITGFNQIVI